MRLVTQVAFLVAWVGCFGCTWTPLRSEGEAVRLVDTPAAECTEVGRATATTRDHVGPFRRSDKLVKRELEHLARNEAGAMGGNTVTPLGPPNAGRQRFRVLRCP